MSNNTTLETCVDNLNYDRSVHISSLIWQIFGLLSFIFGVPGHCLQIILLSNKTVRKQPVEFYFIPIAIFELIYLLASFWLWCVNMSLVKTDPRQVLSCGIFYSIIVGSTTLSNLFLASMSIDRSVMILSPTRYRSIVTTSHVITRSISIFIVIFILLIPHHFYFTYEPKFAFFLCIYHPSVNPRQVRSWALIHTILFVSIPSIIVCISSFILLQNRCKHKRIHKKNLSPSARRVHRRSIFIFFISCGIFLCLLPSCILEVFMAQDRLLYRASRCSIRWKVYRILLNCFLTLMSIIYSMKFYIHLIMSTSFRERFLKFIHCKLNEDRSQTSRINSRNSNEQRLMAPIAQSQQKSTEF